MSGLLEGKVAVVTGASRGIGEALAIRYAMEGAKVVVSARTQNEGDHQFAGSIQSVVDRITGAGGDALGVRADLAVAEHREHLIATTIEHFGRVDVLVNNAAVTYFAPITGFQEKHFNLMQEVQVFAPLHLSQLAIPSMLENGAGWILNISSHAAIHPAKDSGSRGGTVYGMCKAALERFSTGLAAEMYSDKIAVNAISPGLVATPGVVHHKLITKESEDRVVPVENMAEACLRLSHGDPQALTGQVTYAVDVIADHQLTPQALAF